MAALVPAYVDSSSRVWSVLASAPQGVGIVIVNPDSGVGSAPMPSLRRRVAALRRAGVGLVVGYIATDFGRRPVPEVVREMRRYRSWYGIDDYNLSDVPVTARALPYYRELRSAAGGGHIVLSTGAVPDRGYLAVADVITTFEGSERQYREARFPAWTRRYPPARFAHIVYATPARDWPRVVALARSRNAGYLFVTDASLPNPYDVLPTYFGAERRALAG